MILKTPADVPPPLQALPSQTRVPLSAPACRLPAGPSDTFNAVCHAAFFTDKN